MTFGLTFLLPRYPDIRAYDQTRVKLSQIDGVQSTEYINANFVWGYKERKKFICAQGRSSLTGDGLILFGILSKV